MIDARTLIGHWPGPDLDVGLFRGLQDYLETGRGRPVIYFTLTSDVA
jgi:hypothetical protein